jgi:hypothetical protein
MTKSIIKTAIIGTSLSILISGCTSTGQPKIQNEHIGKNKLYIGFNEKK